MQALNVFLKTWIVTFCLAGWLFLTGPSYAVQPDPLATGMNIVNPMRASLAVRTILIRELQAAGVHMVRCGITDDTASIAFAQALYTAGIKIDLIVSPQYAKGAPSRPYDPTEYPDMWGGHPLSAADPTLSKATFQSLIGKLDNAGVVLAGLELGNEINWAAFNPEFPLPGEGKVFNLAELSTDPEGQKVAAGYLQYLKILAVLKQVRDASTINRTTPIISAGLSPAGAARTELTGGRREDAVTIDATLQFLRAHGLDQYVDAYGIHIYPSQNTASGRSSAIATQDVSECGLGGGKPCWVTEWGFDNSDVSCPLDDSARTVLVKEAMSTFNNLSLAHRVSAVIYFSWDSDPWEKQVSPGSVYRCGALTDAGRAALGQ